MSSITEELTEQNTSRTVETPSGTIHYNEAGEGHPILLLHGSGPGATGWSNFGPNLKALSSQFRVIAADMPGWGKSSPVSYEKRDHVTAVLHLLDALGIDQAALVGNSMGGATTLKFSAVHPERVSHLITMGAGAGGVRLFSPGDGPSEGLKILHRGYVEPSVEVMAQLVDIMTFDSGTQSEALAQQRYDNATANRTHLENFASGIGKPRRGTATLEELASISAPTLLVHGRDDRVVGFEHGLQLVAVIRNSRLVLFNRCGHWAQLEHAAEFNRLVADFVANN
ncbi:alpha/beta hydrolase [Knoellia sp. S7-12]|uniref:alpha/beta fold hydrolase n=1 Tax=Knoellia sp. S7-12 TaxID=3126698 RepID=UPI003366A137